jgi:hypothetical protein
MRGFFAVRAQHVWVEGLAGDFGGGVRLECAVRGSGARGEGFGAECWGGVVADLDAWFVLGRGVSW